MSSFTFNYLTIGRDQLASHHPKTSKPLCQYVALHISIIVLRRPDEPSRRFNDLRHHIINEPVFIINSCSFELAFVSSADNV